MTADTRQILVTFPAPVEIDGANYRALVELVKRICKHYEAANPGRVMWAAGMGGYCSSMPITREDEENGVPLTFDMDIQHIEVAERADYKWACAKCGFEHGDHQDHILNPPAGGCEFEPRIAAPDTSHISADPGDGMIRLNSITPDSSSPSEGGS